MNRIRVPRLWPLLVVVALLLAGCPSPSSLVTVSPLPTPTAVTGTSLLYEIIAQGEFSSYPGNEPDLLLITDLEDAHAMIEYLGSTGYRERLVDYVKQFDFSQDVMLAVFRGPHPTGGYEIKIERVIGEGNELHVYAGLCTPDSRPVIAAATNYFQIVKVPWLNNNDAFDHIVFHTYLISCQ